MKFGIRGVLASVALLAGAASSASAAPVPVSVDLSALRAIQTYNLDDNPDKHVDDQAYAVVIGYAGGKEFHQRVPDASKTWVAGPKTQSINDKTPVNLWKGELNDGEFAIITVSIFQGDGKNEDLIKQYTDSIVAAEKGAPELAKATLTLDDFKTLTGDIIKKQFAYGSLVKSERAVITKIKTVFSRAKKTDHFGGLFNIVLWNDGKTIRKRLDPVGVTFGEHYGVDEKIYTKLKWTRANVFGKDEKGEWSVDELAPTSDDEKTVRVKMLETEVIKGTDGNPTRHTTDYLADIQVNAGGKAAKWSLEAEESGVDKIHQYWQFAD